MSTYLYGENFLSNSGLSGGNAVVNAIVSTASSPTMLNSEQEVSLPNKQLGQSVYMGFKGGKSVFMYNTVTMKSCMEN